MPATPPDPSDKPFADTPRTFLYETASRFTPFAVRFPDDARDRSLLEGLLLTPRHVRVPAAVALDLALGGDIAGHLPPRPPRYSPGMAVVTDEVDGYPTGKTVFILGGALGWDRAAHPVSLRPGTNLPGDSPDTADVRLATDDEVRLALAAMPDDTASRLAALIVAGVLTTKSGDDGEPDFL